MIEIFAYRNGGYYRLYVTGHADYHPGNDVVCAGVSALTGALLAYASRSPDCRHLRCFSERGTAFLACRGGLGTAFEAVAEGLSQIAASYPDHVRYTRLAAEGRPKNNAVTGPAAPAAGAVNVRKHA